MAATRLLLGFFSFFISTYLAESSSPVPVLLWSKDSTVAPDQPILAGHTLSLSDFQERFLKKILTKPQTVALFLQDRLSIDDFSRFGDAYSTGSHGQAFSNLKVAMDTANSSVVLPSVDALSNEAAQLETFIKEIINGKLIKVNDKELDTFSASSYGLDDKATNVFLIQLHPVSTRSPQEAEKAFIENDKAIAEITKQVSHLSPSYTCILTASAPNKDVSDEHLQAELSRRPHDRLRRALVDDKASEGDVKNINGSLFVNGKYEGKDCLYIYMSGLVLTRKNKTTDFFNNMTKDPSGKVVKTQCSNTTGANITFSLTFGKTQANFEFQFTRSSYDWKCSTLKFTSDDASFVVPCGKEIQVPLKLSYHCYESTFKNANYTLKIKHFQVQPYNIKDGRFSYAYDCVGFFSIPILMGLFVTGILLMILFIGIMAVFSITTMDRFDDPKGSLRSFGTTTG